MITPHIEENGRIQTVEAYIICGSCDNARHRILPGEKTPWWFCQDEKYELKPGQEIEVEYKEPQSDILCCG